MADAITLQRSAFSILRAKRQCREIEMLCLLKAAALGAVLSINVLTLSSAPARAGEGLPRSAQMLDANVYVPERLTRTAPSLPDDTFAVEKPSRAPRWVVFDFVTGIRTVELADGSMHEELFEPEPLVQMVLSTMPPDAVVTGSVSPAPR